MKNVVIVIPIYTKKLQKYESIAINQAIKLFRGKYDICFLLPDKMKEWEKDKYSFANRHIVPDEQMDSVFSYNEMLLSKWFYDYYMEYRYMLIYQTDAFVFYDNLSYFCKYNYDYIGAPWIYGVKFYDLGSEFSSYNKSVYVGNGGLSLRKIESFRNVLKQKEVNVFEYEDVFWGAQESKWFKVAPIWLACEFSVELSTDVCMRINGGILPMGCHKWMKWNYDFWSKYIFEQGYDVCGIEGSNEEKNYSKWNGQWNELIKTASNYVFRKRIVDRTKKIIIFGVGFYGIECGWLLKCNGYDVVRYIDNNPRKQGRKIWEIEIDDISMILADSYVIVSMGVNNAKEVVRQLKVNGVKEDDILLYHEIQEEIQYVIKGIRGVSEHGKCI